VILVTGATGNIGSELVRQLIEAGQRFRVLTRDRARGEALGDGLDVVVGDLLRPETLAPAFVGVSRALVLAGAADLPSVAAHVVDAAKQAGTRHLVLISSGTIEIKPPGIIARWHLEAEQVLKASGLAWTVLRPGNFSSNALRWAGPIRAQGAVFAHGGDGLTAPIDPRDIASVAFHALTGRDHEGKTYVLTGPALMTVVRQVDVIANALGRPVRFVDVPEDAARVGMRKSGMPELVIDGVIELLQAARAGRDSLLTSTVHDVTARPPRSFDTWVRDHLGAFKN
jgi:(4-alkanoyl-5-oxo-2,5-dihydrofuran-3-yl)methyl phosphate reductase